MLENKSMPHQNFGQLIKIFNNVEDLKPKMQMSDITPSSRFKEDLGFDSLAMMILFVELQCFNPELQPERITNWRKIEDCLPDLE